MENKTQPSQFDRRILLMLCGLTPQVVTETIYALSVTQSPAFIPTEIKVITTEKGAEKALSKLLRDAQWFHRLRYDYQLPEIDFSEYSFEILKGPDGQNLEDIRSCADNESTANQIMHRIRMLTNIDDAALHVSMAGGRKTMGFFAGYALSLYGRVQDRLSHVLISPPYESNTNFFYPTPNSQFVFSPGDRGHEIDAKKAVVTMANIEFVRLRGELPSEFLDDRYSWGDTITSAQKAINSASITIDLLAKKIQVGKTVTQLPAAQLAFLSWLANRQCRHKDWINCPYEGVPEIEHANEYMRFYKKIVGEMGSIERTANRLRNGMTREFFSQTKSKLRRTLRQKLGNRTAEHYLVKDEISNSVKVYGISLKPANIHFGSISRK